MLTKRDIENVFDRVGDRGIDWEFWHDDCGCHIWVSTDGEWLLQVGHRDNLVVLTHKIPDSDEQVAVLARYDGDPMGVKMLTAATARPHRTHTSLCELPATRVISGHITVE